MNNKKLIQEKLTIICLATFNYISWESMLPTMQETKLKEIINKKLAIPGYNRAKGILRLGPHITKQDICELRQVQIQNEIDTVEKKLLEKP